MLRKTTSHRATFELHSNNGLAKLILITTHLTAEFFDFRNGSILGLIRSDSPAPAHTEGPHNDPDSASHRTASLEVNHHDLATTVTLRVVEWNDLITQPFSHVLIADW
jgi:hypothetical protein